MAFPKIAIVVINYRTAQMTLDCLASLEPEVTDLPGTHVVLVDSASGDKSSDLFERERSAGEWDSWLSTFRLSENRGFSAGNNAGIAFAERLAPYDAYLLLNSDTLVKRVRSRRLPRLSRAILRLDWSGRGSNGGTAGCR